MSQNNDQVNSRLDQSINGTAKIKPDEQRKYLGTFRERVSLVIKIKDLSKQHSIESVKKEVQKNPHYQMILNGRISHDLTAPYMKIAIQNNIHFIIKTDSFYFTKPDSYGLVYADQSHAINQYPIDVNAKYPVKPQSSPHKSPKSTHHSFLNKIKNWFK